MIFMLFSLGICVAMFLGSLFLMDFGRRLGARRISLEGNSAMNGLNAVEGAVFALMGLLLAFAISGALQRFDERRQLILQEANAISTSYDRLDILEGEQRLKLKSKLKAYLQNRIELYRLPVEFSIVKAAAVFSSEQQNLIFKLKTEIWEEATTACQSSSNATACSFLLPSLNSVFEVARLRSGANERHPPQIIYVMLFGLGLGGSLLAGVGMGASANRSCVHMITFSAAMSVALYVITDIEFPRLGLITVAYFDHFMDDVYSQMP